MNDDSEVKLLPCPCCVQKAELLDIGSCYFVRCIHCGIKTFEGSKYIVTYTWNTRHSQQSEEMSALECLQWCFKTQNVNLSYSFFQDEYIVWRLTGPETMVPILRDKTALEAIRLAMKQEKKYE